MMANIDSWLVVLSKTPLNNLSSSVGMMNFPMERKVKFMFQTTNQIRFPSHDL